MKRTPILCLALGLILLGATSVHAASATTDIFSIKTAAATPLPMESCTISVTAGEVLELNAWDLERRIGLEEGALQGITITSLPSAEQGGVILDGVEVEMYDFLSREQIDRLCFVPGDGSAGAAITFVPQGSDAVTTSLSIQVLQTPNSPPTVESAGFTTMENVPFQGTLNIYDPEGDTVQIKVLQPPLKGEISFNDRSFQYTPFSDRTGPDSFTVCAVDSYHNYSASVVIEMYIEENSTTFSYADMNGNPSQYAAIKAHERGIYTGVQSGNKYFFHPNKQMNRGDFLILLLVSGGLENAISPTVNTGLPNDSSIPLWLKPYVKKAVDEGIISANQAFHFWEIPIRAEAVLMTDLVAGIDDVKEYPLNLPDQGDIPDWARSSYVDLAAYKMLDLHEGQANPNGALTNSYAIDLAWQLWKHCHR